MKSISVALQGGGSHGAFTWGVLDRLLKEEDLSIAAISGTSSGALNAAAFACGLARKGTEGARDALYALWRGASRAGHPWSAWMASMAAVVGPYSYPLYRNPLVDIIADVIDFDVLQACQAPPVYVCATNVRTNERKVFSTAEITMEVLLASCCLPQLFRAVEIPALSGVEGDGESYWDGGYLGNPVLSPLLRHSQDVVIVQTTPMKRPGVPQTSREISDRINEITFSSALLHEIQTIDMVSRLLEYGELVSARFKPIRFHRILADPTLSGAKTDTSWPTLLSLHAAGWQTTEWWLRDPNRHGKIGVASSLNVTDDLLAPLSLHGGIV